MKENKVLSFVSEGLKDVIDRACSIKHIYSNYYGIDLCGVRYYGNENNLFLLKSDEGFQRVYLLANKGDEIKTVLKSLPANSCINIPSRIGIDIWLPILKEADYKQVAIYHRYCYLNYRKGNDTNLQYAEKQDRDLIDKELHGFFSLLTGHLPNKNELNKMIEDKQIVVNRDIKGQVTGALCYQIKGKKAELPFWYDKDGNGLSLLFNVFYLCHKAAVRRIVFWVNDSNDKTKAIHTMLGAKVDGLVDYIFNNG